MVQISIAYDVKWDFGVDHMIGDTRRYREVTFKWKVSWVVPRKRKASLRWCFFYL